MDRASVMASPVRPEFPLRPIASLVTDALRYPKRGADGNIGLTLIFPHQPPRPFIPVFGRDFDLEKPNLARRLNISCEDLDANHADMQGLAATDHGQEVSRREVTDLRGIKAYVQVPKTCVDHFPQKSMVLFELQLRSWSIHLRKHLLKLIWRFRRGGHESEVTPALRLESSA